MSYSIKRKTQNGESLYSQLGKIMTAVRGITSNTSQFEWAERNGYIRSWLETNRELAQDLLASLNAIEGCIVEYQD